MVELAQLFQQLDEYVVQQEAPLEEIDQRGEVIQENVHKGNDQLDEANKQARSRNRKKWWCLLISSKCSNHAHAPLYAYANQLLQQFSLSSSSWSLSLLWSKWSTTSRVTFISTTLSIRHRPISSLRTPSDQLHLRCLTLLGPSAMQARTILILRGWCWMWVSFDVERCACCYWSVKGESKGF